MSKHSTVVTNNLTDFTVWYDMWFTRTNRVVTLALYKRSSYSHQVIFRQEVSN